MQKKGIKRSTPLTLHRETLKALESANLKEAAGGVSLKCTPTETGLARPQCIC
jgi:hypothetical protein